MTTPARRYLAARVRLGIKMGLDPMRRLLHELGDPQSACPCLLIAGTNGKGSVAAYCDAALRGAGLRVGRYTSPHLVRVNERLVVDGREITDAALDRAVGVVRDAAGRLLRSGVLQAHPTYFEVLTAAAFWHFARRKVDVGVIEVGLGGRLDATNTCEPIASAIVTIGLDHQQYLGTTLAEIAAEKAGVLRRGRTTVVGSLPAEASRAIRRLARARGARVVARDRSVAVPPALPGNHQRHNLQVAVALLDAARDAGLRFSRARALRGLSEARWPGRLQWVRGRPPMLLDGAHNPEGARALAAYVRGRRPFVLVFGVMADKDVESLARTLFPLARDVVATAAPGERAAQPAEILRRAGRNGYAEPSIPRALRRAARLAGEDAFVLVAGSLYLVGDVLRRLQSRSRRRK